MQHQFEAITTRLAHWHHKGMLRRRLPCGAREKDLFVKIKDKTCLSFCHFDYLNLSTDPNVIEAFQQAAAQYGVSSGGSAVVCGYTECHEAFENAFAKFVGRQKALLFSSGFMMNIGVLQGLSQGQPYVFADKRNHASLVDGARFAKGRLLRYRHKDLKHLTLLYEREHAERWPEKFLFTDTVFSMDGDLAPLTPLAKWCDEKAVVMGVDDAHGFGIMGKHGGGALDAFQLTQSEIPLLMVPMGKAMGGMGGMVAGPTILIETILQFARSYRYSTALPPSLAAAGLASLQALADAHEARANLAANIAFFQRLGEKHALPLLPSKTPIQSILIKDPNDAVALQAALLEKGIWVSVMRPPSVPVGSDRLRIILTANHTHTHIATLIEALLDCHAFTCSQ